MRGLYKITIKPNFSITSWEEVDYNTYLVPRGKFLKISSETARQKITLVVNYNGFTTQSPLGGPLSKIYNEIQKERINKYINKL